MVQWLECWTVKPEAIGSNPCHVYEISALHIVLEFIVCSLIVIWEDRHPGRGLITHPLITTLRKWRCLIMVGWHIKARPWINFTSANLVHYDKWWRRDLKMFLLMSSSYYLYYDYLIFFHNDSYFIGMINVFAMYFKVWSSLRPGGRLWVLWTAFSTLHPKGDCCIVQYSLIVYIWKSDEDKLNNKLLS